MIRVIIKGKLYKYISEAHVIAGGDSYMIYGDENHERQTLHFTDDDIDEWIITKESENND